jgi:hypothetical protein
MWAVSGLTRKEPRAKLREVSNLWNFGGSTSLEEVYGAGSGINYSQALEKQKVADSEFEEVLCILNVWAG